MSKLEKLCRLAGAGGILAALVIAPVLLVGTVAHATDAFYVNYFVNAQNLPYDDVVRLIDTNVRPSGNPTGTVPPNPLCAMLYVFDEFQEMQECCGCPVSAGGRLDLSVNGLTWLPLGDYLNNPAFPSGGPSLLTRGTIKIVSTSSNSNAAAPRGPCTGSPQVLCNPTGAFDPNTIATQIPYSPTPYMRAWATHTLLSSSSPVVTETRFERTDEPDSDLSTLENECAVVRGEANITDIFSSGFGALERGYCQAVCTAAGFNPYILGDYGSAQLAFSETEAGQPSGLCYTGQ